MKLKSLSRLKVRQWRQGFTILELWISMAIGTMCLGAVGVIYVEMAKEQRSSLATAVLEQAADNLEDRITQILQTRSATTAATLGDVCSTNSALYATAVFSKGVGNPQESLMFIGANGSVKYDPDINVGGNSVYIYTSETNSVMLRGLYFSLGLKAGNRADGTLVNVSMKLDDDYAARRRSGSTYVVNEINRQFTVRLRGP